jgi:predicted membrane-bound mannosyltransferase/DNA-binding beta-propeller fold protein YncE
MKEGTGPKQSFGGLFQIDWEKALYIAIIVLALSTRLWGLGNRVQSHDESIHSRFSWDLYTGRGFEHAPWRHGPFLYHVTALSYFFFSDNDFTARLPTALIGVLVVTFPWLLSRWLGRTGALVASFFLLVSPSIAYYSRYIRHDIPVMLWSLVVVWAMFSYLRDGRERWLYVMAAGVSLMFATKEVAFIYSAILGFFLVGSLVVQASRREWSNDGLKSLFLAALVALAVGTVALGLGLLTQPEDQVIPAWWAISGGILAGLGALAAIAFLLVGAWRDLRHLRVFDLTVILGSFCLPFLSPAVIQIAGLDPMDYTAPTLYYSGAVAGTMFLLAAGVGLWWNWRRWAIAAAVHYAIFLVLFTAVFTNGTGIASGLIGSLGYWLAQQEVERGSQPVYYYVIMVLLYEYLPLLLTFIACVYLALRKTLQFLVPKVKPASPQSLSPNSQSKASVVPILDSESLFIPFILWWIVTAWLGYSAAGERMPWLIVHLALPMILLSGWWLGRLIEKADWQRLRRLTWPSGWRVMARLLFFVALMVPVLLTIRTAWRFCYTTYDYPTEFLVYAHAAPAVNETMRQIDELSRRIAGGPYLIKFAYGSGDSTLWYWQERNYPNAVFYGDQPSRDSMDAPVVIAGRDEWEAVTPYLSRDYVFNTYTALWWPMEDYRDLSWARQAITDTQVRAALWDIWYDRDYRRYDDLTGKSHTLDQWPLRSEFRLYIRRDVVTQMWDTGATGLADSSSLDMADPYAEGWQDLAARQVFGSQGTAPGQLERPSGIAIDPQGFVYVADTGNHRVQKFTADGQFVAAWGGTDASYSFNEPWGVAVAPDDDDRSGRFIYVADTWNHRVQKLDSAGNLLAAWGTFGQYEPRDGLIGESAFYGPRGIAIGPNPGGPEGRGDRRGHLIYVTDTGNKRVQVFEPDGQFAFQWGGGGVVEGYLDEPVGIAVGPEGVYVADTWNRRVQVFDRNGAFLRQWPVVGWDVGLADEKPFLAVDAEGYVYLTDPGYCRVLVFDRLGNYVLSFGQYGFDERSFALPTGIAVAEDGSVYVSDSHSGRVFIFDPLPIQ